MPETIALPIIEKPAVSATPANTAATTPATSPNEPLKSPLAPIFERALEGSGGMGLDGPPKPAAEPTPTPTPEPTPRPAPAPAPTFELPPEITGMPEPTPTKEPTVDDIMPVEPPESIKGEKDRAIWKKYREHQKYLETELGKTREQLKARPEANADAQAQIDQLQARLVEMSNVVERADLISHPAFQQQFVRPKIEAVESAKQILKEVGLDTATLDRALSAQGQAQREAFDELNESITSPSARMEFVDLVVKIKDLERKQSAAMSDIKGERERIEQADRAQRHQQAQQQLTQIRGMVDAAVEGLRDQAGFSVFKKIEGNEKWNANVDAMISDAKEVMTETTDPMELAATAAMGKAFPWVWQAFLSSEKRRIAGEKELAEVRGATPGLNGSGAGAGAPITESDEANSGKKLFARALEEGKFTVG